MVKYKLIKPCIELEKEFNKLVQDYRRNGIKDYPKYFKEDFSQYLDTLNKFEEGVDLPEGYVTTVTYWLINTGKEILGTIRYREHLNEYTIIDGGNIGYDVSPSYRKLGYCTIMMKQLLEKLKERKVEKVLLTVEENNVASIKVIENFGGIVGVRHQFTK